jgi:hypothetical protein
MLRGTRYGPGSSRLRPHDGGDSLRDPATTRERKDPGPALWRQPDYSPEMAQADHDPSGVPHLYRSDGGEDGEAKGEGSCALHAVQGGEECWNALPGEGGLLLLPLAALAGTWLGHPPPLLRDCADAGEDHSAPLQIQPILDRQHLGAGRVGAEWLWPRRPQGQHRSSRVFLTQSGRTSDTPLALYPGRVRCRRHVAVAAPRRFP